MMIHSVNFLLIILFGSFLNARERVIPEHEKYVNELVKSFAAEMEKELNLECIGNGGRMPHDVEQVKVIFQANRRATLEEARKIEIFAAERLLQRINAHEKLKPFLREYPFTAARINVNVSFGNELHQQYGDGTITLMFLVKGNIYYHSYDPVEEKIIDLREESYQEALKIAQSAPLEASELREHNASPYEKDVDQFLNDFARKVEKKWGLCCSGQGGKLVNGIEEFGFKFVTDKCTPLPQARKLYVEIMERLQGKINANPAIRPYLKEYPFPTERIKISIQFHKEEKKLPHLL